jgi:peptidoglycan biosynthesis protein MviN/MurJ (putative lipid II flippase)
VQTVLLVQALRRKVPQLFLRGLGAPLAKVLAASAVMGGAVALGAMFIDPGKSGSSLAGVLLPLIALGAVVYAAAARVLGVEEVGVLLGKLRKRLYGRGKSAAGPSTKE